MSRPGPKPNPVVRTRRFQLFLSAAERDALRRIAIARGTDASSAIRTLIAEELRLLTLGGRVPLGETNDETNARVRREIAAGFHPRDQNLEPIVVPHDPRLDA